MEMSIQAGFRMNKEMVKVYINGNLEINMKGSGRMVNKTEKEKLLLKMDKLLKGNGKMVYL